MSLLVSNTEVAVAPEEKGKPGSQISFTVTPTEGETIAALCRRLAQELRAHGATPLHLLAFGDIAASAAVADALRTNLGRVDWPVTWVEGAACGSHPVAGLQLQAFTGEVERISFRGRAAGSVFTDGGARQCVIGGLLPTDQSLSRADQTRQALEDLQTVLDLGGFKLADVVRTWFYLDDILSWYDDFNRARTKIYSRIKFRTGSLPASTGIGAKNPAGAALTLAAWAVQPLEENARAEEIASPLQCPAPAYGSSFSRAMEIPGQAGRHLLISGTASIAPGGATVWQGDVRRQVELTMEVVEAILHARGYSFADLTRAVAYFKHAQDAGTLREWCETRGWPALPMVTTHSAVCRDDLLFELEADAFRAQTTGED
jgi:enamine deaminase RidA (YjgF/YER057c/UK114 family)